MDTALALLVVAVIGVVVGGSIVYKYKKIKKNPFDKMFGDMDLKNKNVKCHLS